MRSTCPPFPPQGRVGCQRPGERRHSQDLHPAVPAVLPGTQALWAAHPPPSRDTAPTAATLHLHTAECEGRNAGRPRNPSRHPCGCSGCRAGLTAAAFPALTVEKAALRIADKGPSGLSAGPGAAGAARAALHPPEASPFTPHPAGPAPSARLPPARGFSLGCGEGARPAPRTSGVTLAEPFRARRRGRGRAGKEKGKLGPGSPHPQQPRGRPPPAQHRPRRRRHVPAGAPVTFSGAPPPARCHWPRWCHTHPCHWLPRKAGGGVSGAGRAGPEGRCCRGTPAPRDPVGLDSGRDFFGKG